MTPRKSRQHRDERAQLALTAECAGYLDANPLLFDAVIDVSGFAYGDDWGLAGYRRIAPIVRHCQRAGKQVIFMPQAWGPFKSEGGRAAIGSLLSGQHVRYYSRDKQSSRHLESVLGKSSQAATPYPDIAFLFQGDSPDRGAALLQSVGFSMKRPVIGIAPNLRVYERVDGHRRGNPYLAALAALARRGLDDWGVDVLLLPNEVGSSGRDDRDLCEQIARMVARPDRCRVIGDYLPARSVWALVARLEFLFASRFHALVFAFSQGVPATALGWSHEYEELFALFGWAGSVAAHEQIDEDCLLASADEAWRERAARRAHLASETPPFATGWRVSSTR